MNKITDIEIMNHIKDKYNLIITKYTERKILGVFAIGNVNYGFAESVNEINLMAIYVPDFEELCLGTLKDEYMDNIHIIDIRSFYNAAKDENDGYALELLYSYYTIISPIYTSVYTNYFLNKLDIIVNYSESLRVKKLLKRILKTRERDDAFEAARINAECHAFLTDKNSMEWLRPANPLTVNYLWGVKKGEISVWIDELISDIHNISCELNDFQINEDAETVIKTGILKLMDVALYKKIDIDGFLSCLTNTEKSALSFLKKHLTNGAGNISIVKIIEESNISRPVYKNLLQKMESYNIAKITNMGVKGMHIEILEKEIL